MEEEISNKHITLYLGNDIEPPGKNLVIFIVAKSLTLNLSKFVSFSVKSNEKCVFRNYVIDVLNEFLLSISFSYSMSKITFIVSPFSD